MLEASFAGSRWAWGGWGREGCVWTAYQGFLLFCTRNLCPVRLTRLRMGNALLGLTCQAAQPRCPRQRLGRPASRLLQRRGAAAAAAGPPARAAAAGCARGLDTAGGSVPLRGRCGRAPLPAGSLIGCSLGRAHTLDTDRGQKSEHAKKHMRGILDQLQSRRRPCSCSRPLATSLLHPALQEEEHFDLSRIRYPPASQSELLK